MTWLNKMSTAISLIFIFTYNYKRNKIKFSNFVEALKQQLPLKRALYNFFITGNAWGMLSIYSHLRRSEIGASVLKTKYNTKETAIKSAKKMEDKLGKHFSYYKCVFCDGYHIGKNKDNK